MKPAALAVKLIVQIIDGYAHILQETKTIITAIIKARIHTVDRYRMIRLLHFPHHRRQMVYIVKVPDKKKKHLLRADSKKFCVDLIHTGLFVFAQQLLEARNSITQVLSGDFRILFEMVLQ